MLKRALRGLARRGRDWLSEERRDEYEYGGPPYSYEDSTVYWRKLVKEHGLRRPHFAWGAVQAVNLAKALGLPRISLVEFGVAGGNGLTALESIAARLEPHFGVGIEVHGFDAVEGMPKTEDNRDLPNLWRAGFYPMDREKLERRLSAARLHLGLVRETVERFVASTPAPIGFIAFDLCFYSSTRDAFRVFDAEQALLLPRVHLFFRNVLGRTFGDFNGERLAMAEFNETRPKRKISKIYGLQYYVGSNVGRWVDQYYMAHLFDHDLYGRYDGLIREAALELGEGEPGRAAVHGTGQEAVG